MGLRGQTEPKSRHFSSFPPRYGDQKVEVQAVDSRSGSQHGA